MIHWGLILYIYESMKLVFICLVDGLSFVWRQLATILFWTKCYNLCLIEFTHVLNVFRVYFYMYALYNERRHYKFPIFSHWLRSCRGYQQAQSLFVKSYICIYLNVYQSKLHWKMFFCLKFTKTISLGAYCHWIYIYTYIYIYIYIYICMCVCIVFNIIAWMAVSPR